MIRLVFFLGMLASSFAASPFGDKGSKPVAAIAEVDGVWRVETLAVDGPDNAAGLRLRITEPVAAGRYAIKVAFRAVRSPRPDGVAFARLQFGPVDRTEPLVADAPIRAGASWQEYVLPLRIAAPLGAGAALLQLAASVPGQIADVRGLSFVKLEGPAESPLPEATGWTYEGRDPDATWRKQARERIARVRQTDFTISLTDVQDRPLAGRTLDVELVRHAFPFGSAVQAARLIGRSADDLRYQQEFSRLFNAAVLENDLKWPAWAGEWSKGGNITRGNTLSALQWLKAGNFRVRAHCLLWGSRANIPASVHPLLHEPVALQAAILSHIRDITSATRGFVSEWDVVNEPRSHPRIYALLGPEAVAEWFRSAGESDSAARLFVNEYDLLNNTVVPASNHRMFLDWIATQRAAGAEIQAIGEQAHFTDTALPPPEQVLKTLDLLATTGLPIVITEHDINSRNEQLQADYTRDFLLAAFSHASVDGFYFWGFWEKAHWVPSGALLRGDWSEKPALRAYHDLVHGEWKTRVQMVTDSKGAAHFRGFPGDYEIRVDSDTHRSPLTPTTSNIRISTP